MPLPQKRLVAEKLAFLAKFNLTAPRQLGWELKAYADAMTASTRRTRLFRPGLTQAQRNLVREGWRGQLAQLVLAYVANGPVFATSAQFLSDIVALRRSMNADYACYFHAAPVNGYPPGFRIAHAQKSLSLVLKHFWCNGALGEPPSCPVDRRILTIAGARGSDARWTDVDTIPQYTAKLARLSAEAAVSRFDPISLAEWELQAFN